MKLSAKRILHVWVAVNLVLAVNALAGQTSSAAEKHKTKIHNSLVPPPPPTVPLGGQYIYMVGAPPELMSEADLKKRLKELTDQLSKSRGLVADASTRAKDKEQRSKLFADLYKEGVISRKELEASQDESLRATQEAQSCHDELTSTEREFAQVEAQINRRHPAAKSASVKAALKSNKKRAAGPG